MNISQWVKRLAPVLLSFVLLLTACTSAPSKYDQVQQETTGFKAEKAVDKQAQKGGTFNQFFPGSQGNYEVVPSQEKQGFAEYKLNQDGQTVAMLTINDTISLPAAAAKYENAPKTLVGYPTVEQGATATGILVNGRYQVKVLSRDPAFTAEDRAAWIQKFDLKGLAQLDAGVKSNPLKKVLKQAKGTANEEKPALPPQAAPVLAPQPAA